jgi:general secretion pathway protein D
MSAGLLLLITGCAEQQINERSHADLAAGQYEHAISSLQAGVHDYPDSALLRSGLLAARTQATAHLISQASSLAAAGKYPAAQALLERVTQIDPDSQRARELLDQLAIEQQQQRALADAQRSADAGNVDVALKTVAEALKGNPRHIGLNDLQRRLEMRQREAGLRNSSAVLSDKRPISLDFRDASLRTVLDVVSRSSGINFVFDRDIRSDLRVTVLLRQARIEDALDLITSTNQLAMKVVDERTVQIYPNTSEKQREYQEQVVRVFYLANADAKGAAAFLKSMLKVHEPFVDDRSNMLALRDSPDNIQLAERLVTLYDSAEPEVELEIQVLEISSTRLTELGVQFPTSLSLTPVAPGGDSSTGSGLTLGNIRSLTRNNILLGLGGVTVNLRREVGDFSTLSNPRIRVRNKEKAKVLVGDKIPIVTSTTGQAGFVSDNVSYLDVGLKLDVEPTIYADDDISIRVGLEVSSLGSAVKTSSGTLAYQIGTRNASTNLRLHDGETQVLAGLISKNESSASNRLPGLGDLPILGRLFSSTLDNGDRKELVLAITPRIVRNLRRLPASESELWVGTEANPRLRPVGGLRAAPPSAAASGNGAGTSTFAATPQPAEAALMPPMPATPDGLPIAMPQPPRIGWIAPAKVKKDEIFDATLVLTTEFGVRGMVADLRYDPQKLACTNVVEGEFMKQGATATSLSKTLGSGTLQAGVIRTTATGAVGQGGVFTLQCKALTKEDASIEVISAKPVGLDGPLPQATLPLPRVIHVE